MSMLNFLHVVRHSDVDVESRVWHIDTRVLGEHVHEVDEARVLGASFGHFLVEKTKKIYTPLGYGIDLEIGIDVDPMKMIKLYAHSIESLNSTSTWLNP